MSTRLSEQQIVCLWGLSLGSKGRGSNARTLESLHRRGLAFPIRHQGEQVWETTRSGEDVLNADEWVAS